MKSFFLIAFILVSLLYLWGNATGYPQMVSGAKPFLMPLLAAWLVAANLQASFLRNAVLGALLFSTLGDVLLMFPGALYFLLGLAAFLLAHICYTLGFWSVSGLNKGFLRRNPWWALPFLAFPFLLLSTIWEGIPSGMKFPVVVYAAMISLMALSAFNLKDKTTWPVFTGLLSGAVLFMLSDSLIALHKFGSGKDMLDMAVMPTYLCGQFLLVWATIWISRQNAVGLTA